MLEGKIALVTGAGAGIGRATSLALARAGAAVAVWDIDREAAAESCALIEAAGGKALPLLGSVADPHAVRAGFAELQSAWGGADILINNAGISANKPTLELTDAEWTRATSINLDGVFFCAREAARSMQTRGGGCIVNLSSIYGLVAGPNRLAYVATKSAVSAMTKALALEWAPLGIRVNAVAPGYIQTALLQTLADQGRVDAAALKRRTPQGRFGTVEEVADAILYLCEPRSAFVTGHVLSADGGWVANGYL